MKTFISILLFGLLGFLGCSDSNDGTTATVGQAILVAPLGIVETPTPTYEWTPVRWATKYHLVVQETSQESTIQDATETYVIDEWYTAEEAGCASEEALCIRLPDTEVIGENSWKIQACADQECGLWSEQLNFNFTSMNGPRFTDHGDGTATDNNTRLMWFKDAQLCIKSQYPNAKRCCAESSLAGHTDWLLPSISELRTLIDFSQENPALPKGHPFVNVMIDEYGMEDSYWSCTLAFHVSPPPSDLVYVMNFTRGNVYISGTGESAASWNGTWCVRSDH